MSELDDEQRVIATYYNFTKTVGSFVDFDEFLNMEAGVISEVLLIEQLISDKINEDAKRKRRK